MSISDAKGIDVAADNDQRFPSRLNRILDKVIELCADAAGYIMLIVAFIMVYEIIMRKLGHPTIWVTETSGYSMVWFAFLAAAYGLLRGTHIQVDVLINRLDPDIVNALDIINYLLMTCFLAALLYYGSEMFIISWELDERTATLMDLPIWIINLGVAVGSVLLTAEAFRIFISKIIKFKQSSKPLSGSVAAILFYAALIITTGFIYLKMPMLGAILFMLIIMFGGLPIFASLSVIGSLGLLGFLGVDLGLSQISAISVKTLDSFTLLAIPLYMLAGQIIMSGGIGKELFDVCSKWIGHWPGGFLIATILSCGIFAAISGSSVATAATIGYIAIPEMLKRGINPVMAYGSVCAGGTLGILIPPSASMIIFSSITEESTGALFIGGVVPGILLMALFAVYSSIAYSRIPGYQKFPKATWKERFVSIKDAFWGLMTPVIILGTIYFGIVTPTEAAAIAVIYALLISFARRKINLRDLNKVMSDSTRGSTMVLMIVVGAIIFGTVITFLQIPQTICNYVISLNLHPAYVITWIAVIYVILGCFLEVASILMITLPIVYPLIINLGFNGVWFGVWSTLLMEMALITPPVGLNMYVVKGISKAPMLDIIKGTWPYMFIILLELIVLYLWPQLITWLPGSMGFINAG